MKKTFTFICALSIAMVQAADFTPGNIVVTQSGNTTTPAALNANTTQVSLVEYTPSGTLVQTIPLSIAGADKLTIGGLNSTAQNLEGQLSLSQDGRYLSLIGYDVPAGEVTTNTALSVITFTNPSGTGYAVNDIITFTGNGGTATAQVTSVNGTGGVTGLLITNGGSGFTGNPATITSTTGVGSGITVTAYTRVAYWQSFSTKKVIARVNYTGAVDYSTKFTGSGTNANGIVKKAVTVDGSKYWYPANRLENIAFGSTGTSTNINASDAIRSLEIFKNQLYYIMGFNATGLKYTNTALPETTSASTSTGLAMSAAGSSPIGFAFLDLDPSISWNGTGYDLLYVADIIAGLEKYYYDGTNWVPVNSKLMPVSPATPLNNHISFGAGYKPAAQITATVNSSNQPVVAVIYGGANEVGGGTANGLAIVTDASGRTGTMTTGAGATITITYPATPATNYAFRGVAFAPQIVPSQPNSVLVSTGNTLLSVAFTTPENNGGSAITNYKYSTNGGATFTACSPVQTTSPIVITGLTNETLYNVQIKAVNANGDGTSSQIKQGTPSLGTAVNPSNVLTAKVLSIKGGISIESANKETYKVINTMGQVIAKGIVTSENEFVPVNAQGIVFVQINKQVIKVLLSK